MKKLILLVTSSLLFQFNIWAQKNDSTELSIDQIEESLHYQTGTINLSSGNATLNVPKGFKYLDQKQSIYVLTDLWGNPVDSSILGMLVPEKMGVLTEKGWAFTISYDEMGYVKDDDAEKINYSDLLKNLQKETNESNAERAKQGYAPITLVNWASNPYYDKDKKTLHWAKELKFGTDSVNTLNYNLRILGRKGVFMLNAVASMNEIDEVKANIDPVLNSVVFKDGNKYSDFKPDVDQVAAWTIGGLVAGKILAKVGFFAVILKFWKLIALAVAGAGGSVWRFIRGRKKEENTTVVHTEVKEIEEAKPENEA